MIEHGVAVIDNLLRSFCLPISFQTISVPRGSTSIHAALFGTSRTDAYLAGVVAIGETVPSADSIAFSRKLHLLFKSIVSG